jgi:hypothetical protein
MMDEVQVKNFESMDVVHHILSGFKAQFTEEMNYALDVARRSTGGAGYQSSSGFTTLINNSSPYVTYEGDNIVMFLQASRYVFKLVKWA